MTTSDDTRASTRAATGSGGASFALVRWWLSLDRWLLGCVALLCFFGLLIQFGLSPLLGKKFGLAPYAFAVKHSAFVAVSLSLALVVSVSPRTLLVRAALLVLVVSLCLSMLLLFVAEPYYGARRWLSLGYFSVQPSEFMKPSFVVLSAALFSRYLESDRKVAWLWGVFALYAPLAMVLFLQPDVGQLLLLTVSLLAMWFVAGMSFSAMVAWSVALPAGGLALYRLLPHVAERFDAFLAFSLSTVSSRGDQVSLGLQLLIEGGMFGKGLGIGKAGARLFDPQSDFVFVALGEQLGIVIALLVVFLYASIGWRVLLHTRTICSPFALLAATGLWTQIVCQAGVNMGSALGLLPPKGTTLPWISAGGSSLGALGLTLGCLLILTRTTPSRAWQP